MTIEKIKIIIGDEFDVDLRNALRIVLLKNHAIVVDKSWGIGGSQEVETLHAMLGNDLLVIEAETYIGLSISGPRLIVEELVAQIRGQGFQEKSISGRSSDSVERPSSSSF